MKFIPINIKYIAADKKVEIKKITEITGFLFAIDTILEKSVNKAKKLISLIVKFLCFRTYNKWTKPRLFILNLSCICFL